MMASGSLKFLKIKNLDDFNCKFEKIQITDLESTASRTTEELHQNYKALFSELENITKEYSLRIKLEKENAVLYQQDNSLSYKLLELRKELQSRKSEKQRSDLKKELTKSVLGFYEQNLCLRIEPAGISISEEDSVFFVFHNISEKNPERTYSFILTTDGSRYNVERCHPPVNEVSELLANLNKTNNLLNFTQDMRKSFKSITM